MEGVCLQLKFGWLYTIGWVSMGARSLPATYRDTESFPPHQSCQRSATRIKQSRKGRDSPLEFSRPPNAQAQQPRQPDETSGPGKPYTAAAVGCSALLGDPSHWARNHDWPPKLMDALHKRANRAVSCHVDRSALTVATKTETPSAHDSGEVAVHEGRLIFHGSHPLLTPPPQQTRQPFET